MVRFCNICKRAVDDLDKFCRSCGQSTNDSIDYHTYYRFFIKDDNNSLSNGIDIVFRQEIKEINEKVDLMYQRLFPPSVGELREELGSILEKKGEHKEEKPLEIETLDKVGEHKDEHKEAKPVEKPPEIGGEHKDEHKEAEPVEKSPEIGGEHKKEAKPIEKSPEIGGEHKKEAEPIEKSSEIGGEHKGGLKNENDWLLQDVGKESKNQGELEVSEEVVPEEVNDKLGMLLQEDDGQRQAIQYLIDRHAKNIKGKNVDNDINNLNLMINCLVILLQVLV